MMNLYHLLVSQMASRQSPNKNCLSRSRFSWILKTPIACGASIKLFLVQTLYWGNSKVLTHGAGYLYGGLYITPTPSNSRNVARSKWMGVTKTCNVSAVVYSFLLHLRILFISVFQFLEIDHLKLSSNYIYCNMIHLYWQVCCESIDPIRLQSCPQPCPLRARSSHAKLL